jgi:hypothetical protein
VATVWSSLDVAVHRKAADHAERLLAAHRIAGPGSGERVERVDQREAGMRLEREVQRVLHVEEPEAIERVVRDRRGAEQHEALVDAEVERHVLADAVGQLEPGGQAALLLGLDRVAVLRVGEAELVARTAAVGIEVAALAHQAGARREQRHRAGPARREQQGQRERQQRDRNGPEHATHGGPPRRGLCDRLRPGSSPGGSAA